MRNRKNSDWSWFYFTPNARENDVAENRHRVASNRLFRRAQHPCLCASVAIAVAGRAADLQRDGGSAVGAGWRTTGTPTYSTLDLGCA